MSLTLLLTLVPFATDPAQSASPAPQGEDVAPTTALVRLRLAELESHAEHVRLAEFDVVYRDAQSETCDVLVTASEEQELARLGWSYEVIHDDVARFYAERAQADIANGRAGRAPLFGAWLTPPFGQGSMAGYYTWPEMSSVLDQIAAAYPSIVTPKFSLGSGHEGRELWAVKLSDNPGLDEDEPESRIDAMHHAREPGGMHTALWALLYLTESYGTDPLATWLVDNREVWFVPCVNPDGYEYNRTTNPGGGGLWRKNRRNNGSNFGVDLNRNYPVGWGWDNVGSSPSSGASTYRGPSAASEPEIQAMTAFMANRNFGTALTLHTYSNLWLSNWGYISAAAPDKPALDEIGMLATYRNGYPFGSCFSLLYPINGGTQDTDYGTHGTFSWLPEIGSTSDGFWPPPSRIIPLAEENRMAIARTILAAGAWVRVESVDLTEIGDGDGNYEPGESFEVRYQLRNSGRLATDGSVQLLLENPSASVLSINGSIDLGPLGGFSSVNNNANPLIFQIAAGATPGEVADVLATVRWEGFSESQRYSRPVGSPGLYLSDPVESDLGWIAGVPGDTATTGLWEFGAPVGTFSAGQPANPGADATLDGTRCFTTGNGATSSSGDDVDDGRTTLITPRIDLASANSALVSFKRWFANFTNNDDVLEIAVSNDDGANWVNVLTLDTTANSWTETSFVVNNFVAPSDSVRLRFALADEPDNSILEAAVDDLRVEVFEAGPFLHLYGRPLVGAPIVAHITAESAAPWLLFWSPATANLTLPAFNGTILIDPLGAMQTGSGTISGLGLGRTTLVSPNDPNLVGTTIYFQGLVATSAGLTLTGRDSVTFE